MASTLVKYFVYLAILASYANKVKHLFPAVDKTPSAALLLQVLPPTYFQYDSGRILGAPCVWGLLNGLCCRNNYITKYY